MASLSNLHSQQICHLLPHHTFGRREDKVDTHLDAPQISKIHASIEWDGQHWQLKDLSRNGVWVDGEKADPSQTIALKVGQTIQFVSKELRFEVRDLNPPSSCLVPSSSRNSVIPLDKLHLLPNDDSPLAALQLCPESHDWLLDVFSQEQEPASVSHGEKITLADDSWVLNLADRFDSPTLIIDADYSLNKFDFCFHTTLDEENTSLELNNGKQRADLGERSHHYVLLHLARKRALDLRKGLSDFDQGWIDNELLCREIGMDLAHINIQLYRLRKQLMDSVPDITGVNKMVERKRGKVRFGNSNFKIYKSGELETEKTPAA